MRLLRRHLAAPRGFALPLSLLVLMLLSTLSLALLSMSAFEPLISKNLADAEQARFVAEAGIEWAFSTLRDTLDWDAFLSGADPARGAVMTTDSPLPGHAASAGTYTVRVRNDSLSSDPLVTGVPADGGGPTHDTNSQVLVSSVGRVAAARRVVQVVLRRTELPPIPAALAFPGQNAAVSVSGSFEIDGNDVNPDGSPGSCAPVFGISVSALLPDTAPGANEAAVEDALAGYASNVRGKKQDPTDPGVGANTIAPDLALTPAQVQSFTGAAQKADIVLAGTDPDGLAVRDIGGSCTSNWSSAACWGTSERPKVVYVKGNSDPASTVSVLQISGNTEGHGILIVEDGALSITGNFLWQGLIIVTGSGGALSFVGDGDQAVYGAVIFNDTSSDAGPGKGVLTGNARLRYSCQALDQARRARKLVTMRSWREIAR